MKFYAKAEFAKKEFIKDIVKSKGIVYPSKHSAFFYAKLLPVEVANGNGVRVTEKAAKEAMATLNGSQVNFEHDGIVCGYVIESFWNEEQKSVDVLMAFHKELFQEEFEEALEKLAEGKLSVSFELVHNAKTTEILDDGTRRLNDIIFTGVGFLIKNPPAYKTAKVKEVARRTLDRLQYTPDLIFASKIKESCEKILAEDKNIFIVTSVEDDHFHVSQVDENGDGKTIAIHGSDAKNHVHNIKEWNIENSDNHTHEVQDKIIAQIKELIEKNKKEDEKGGQEMNEEQKALVEKLKAELGDFAKDFKDEDFLDESKVEAAKEEMAKFSVNTKVTEDKTETIEDNGDTTVEKTVEAEKTVTHDDGTTSTDKFNQTTVETFTMAQVDEIKSSYEKQIEELKNTLEAKDSEIASVRENAEKIGQLKAELKDNPYCKDFKNEDYLDESKVENARIKKENDDLKAKLKESEKEESEEEAKEESEEDNYEEKEKSNLETGHDESTPKSDMKKCQGFLDKRFKELRKTKSK